MNIKKILNLKKIFYYNFFVKNQENFLWIISHEIKTPLSICLFQADSLIQDLDEWEKNIEYIKKEISNIEKQLEKLSLLVNNIFENQRYALWKIKLEKQNVNIKCFLNFELLWFKKLFKNIDFQVNIWEEVWNFFIDKTNISQVISNIICNAIKFSNENNKKILIEVYLSNSNLIIDIEDNWKWLVETSSKNVFKKYNTWFTKSDGIGMWLYLCDQIVKVHWW
jgi:two-component system, OmpR family, phosphate regulon sensor histidine kinase PhoR